MTHFPIKEKTFKTHDGTLIAHQSMGTGKTPIILCNGLGGFASAWRPIFDAFGKEYTFWTWDYRGLLRSQPPDEEARLTMMDHVHDLKILMETENIDSALVIGWSMGVQVALEYYKNFPKKVKALVLMNGTAGFPFDTALNSSLSKYILPKINELAKKIVPAIQPTIKPLAKRIIDWKGFIKLVSKLGLVHENLLPDIFREVATEMIEADLKYYHQIMSHLSKHDASDMLETIKVPTLIIAGDEDKLTPLAVSEKMAKKIPNAELFVVPHGTHYVILEFPENINRRLGQFLKEHYNR